MFSQSPSAIICAAEKIGVKEIQFNRQRHCRFIQSTLLTMNSKVLFCAVLTALPISITPSTFAQSAQPGASPVTAPAVTASNSPTAAMTYPDGSSLSVRSHGGHFPLVAGPAGQTVNIQLRFPSNPANTALTIGALDGGTIPQSSTSVASDGTASLQFQPGTQPGRYRVLLNQGGSLSTLEFWVPDPQRPNSGPPAVQPSPGG